MRKLIRFALWVLLSLMVLCAGYLALAPTGRYLVRAAWEEGRILARRRPIAQIIADSTTSPEVRDKLHVVLDARAFAQDSLHLAAKQSFTTYSRVAHDTLVLVLSGAYRDRLQPVTWWFPIVGRVPYKGYFDFAAAHRAADALRAQGFDAYVRPSPAFSTLGFFNDPLLSTSLEDDSLSLANTVIHELTHNTFYAAGQVPFNESFANFVGARGAEWFFRSRGDSLAAREVAARWHDDKVLAVFWQKLYHTMDSAYKAHPDSRDARIAAHDSVFAQARRDLVSQVGPQLHTIDPRYLANVRLDNSVLMAQRIYRTNLDDFDVLYARNGNDLRRTVAQIIALAKANPRDPFAALHQAASGAAVAGTRISSAPGGKPSTQ